MLRIIHGKVWSTVQQISTLTCAASFSRHTCMSTRLLTINLWQWKCCVCVFFLRIWETTYRDFFTSSVLITSKSAEQSEKSSTSKSDILVRGNTFIFLFTAVVICLQRYFLFMFYMKKINPWVFFFKIITLLLQPGSFFYIEKWPSHYSMGVMIVLYTCSDVVIYHVYV